MASPPPVLHMQLPLRPATAVTTTTSSPLLALPPELRNRIHEYAVCSPEEIVVGTPHHISPPLARVNHQLRTETRPIYLRLNHFRFPGGYGTRWLYALSDKRQAQIRYLHIDLGASHREMERLFELGLTPTHVYDEENAQLGWRIVWVGGVYMPELRRRDPGKEPLTREEIRRSAERCGWGESIKC